MNQELRVNCRNILISLKMPRGRGVAGDSDFCEHRYERRLEKTMAAWCSALRASNVAARSNWNVHRKTLWQGRHCGSLQKPHRLLDNTRGAVCLCCFSNLVLVLCIPALTIRVRKFKLTQLLKYLDYADLPFGGELECNGPLTSTYRRYNTP